MYYFYSKGIGNPLFYSKFYQKYSSSFSRQYEQTRMFVLWLPLPPYARTPILPIIYSDLNWANKFVHLSNTSAYLGIVLKLKAKEKCFYLLIISEEDDLFLSRITKDKAN